MIIPFKWHQLDENTLRARVIGGWIVYHDKHALVEKNGKSHLLCSESMIFIPDPQHQWLV